LFHGENGRVPLIILAFPWFLARYI
jgi:hypothetical protein